MKPYDKDLEILANIRRVLEQQIELHLAPDADNPAFEKLTLTEAIEAKSPNQEAVWKSGFVSGIEYVNQIVIQYLIEGLEALNDEEEESV